MGYRRGEDDQGCWVVHDEHTLYDDLFLIGRARDIGARKNLNLTVRDGGEGASRCAGLAKAVQPRQGVGPDIFEPHRPRASYDVLDLVRQPVAHGERQRFAVLGVRTAEVPRCR